MKVTYKEILSAHQATRKLISNSDAGAGVTPLAALRLARAARVISQEAEAFETARLALIAEYVSEPDEQGNRTVPSENIREFNDRYAELTKEEIEIDVALLNLVDFGDSKIGLTALIGMEWLFDEKQGAKKPRKKPAKRRPRRK